MDDDEDLPFGAVLLGNDADDPQRPQDDGIVPGSSRRTPRDHKIGSKLMHAGKGRIAAERKTQQVQSAAVSFVPFAESNPAAQTAIKSLTVARGISNRKARRRVALHAEMCQAVPHASASVSSISAMSKIWKRPTINIRRNISAIANVFLGCQLYLLFFISAILAAMLLECASGHGDGIIAPAFPDFFY